MTVKLSRVNYQIQIENMNNITNQAVRLSVPGSEHAVTSIGDTEIGLEGSDGSKVTSTFVPSSVTGISTVPSG